MRLVFVFVLFLLIAFASYSQRVPEYRVTIGGNARPPEEFGEKLGLEWTGGSLGLSYFKPLREHLDLKTSVGFSRQVYWNEPVYFNKGPSPQDALGHSDARTIEYYTSFNGIVQYIGSRGFTIGIGLGAQVLMSSTKKILAANTAGSGKILTLKNKAFKPIMPVVPFEIGLKKKRMMYNSRLEVGLLNRYRNDLKAYDRNLYGLLTFEVGMKLGPM